MEPTTFTPQAQVQSQAQAYAPVQAPAQPQPHDYLPEKGYARIQGENIKVNERAIDDFRLIEASSKIMEGDVSALIGVLHLVFPDDSYERVKQLATLDDYVSTQRMSEILNEVLNQLNPNS